MRHGPQADFVYTNHDGEDAGLTGERDFIALLASYQIGAVVNDRFFFFGGAGAGISKTQIDVENGFGGFARFEDNALAWQVFVGAEFLVSQNISLRAGYRHLWVDEMSDWGVEFGDEDTSVIEVGLTGMALH